MKWEEENLQIRCVTFLTYCYSHLFWFHCPNEAQRTKVQAGFLKKMGMRPGYPDLDIIEGNLTVHVEFKTAKGRQSDDQKRMQQLLEEQGHPYYICRSYEEFMEICHKHFGPERDPNVEQLKKILGK